MLVISRKPQEFVQIGDEIQVKIIRTGRGAVKIGIEAPSGLRVLRGELVLETPESAPEPPRRSNPMRGGLDRLQHAKAL